MCIRPSTCAILLLTLIGSGRYSKTSTTAPPAIPSPRRFAVFVGDRRSPAGSFRNYITI